MLTPPPKNKTSPIRNRDVLAELGRKTAYVVCCSSAPLRSAARDAVDQLRDGATRRRERGFGRETRGDHVADFVPQFSEVAPSDSPEPRYVILDDAHELPGKGGEGAAALIRAVEATGGNSRIGRNCGRTKTTGRANLTFIFISSTGWAAGGYERETCACPPLHEVEFPPYTPEQASTILALDAPGAEEAAAQALAAKRSGGGNNGNNGNNGEEEEATAASPLARQFTLYLAMLRGAVLPLFGRDSVCLSDLRDAASWLWPRFSAPDPETGLPREPARAHAAVRPLLAAARRAMDEGLPLPGTGNAGTGGAWSAAAAGAAATATSAAATAAAASAAGLDLELPYQAKFLLLAAHIASHNKEVLDRRLFDPDFRAARRRGRGRGGAASAMGGGSSSAFGADAASSGSAAANREPQTFPTERLLAIFWHLCAAESSGGGAGGSDGQQNDDCGRADQSADVMAQLASLVSLGLLSRERDGLSTTAGGPLDSTRYASRVPRALAERVARNVQVDLRTYLLTA